MAFGKEDIKFKILAQKGLSDIATAKAVRTPWICSRGDLGTSPDSAFVLISVSTAIKILRVEHGIIYSLK